MSQISTNEGEKFTLEKIKAANAKTKTGADFPSYIKEIKKMGVTSYEHYVADGHIKYAGNDNFSIVAEAKWETKQINTESNTDALKASLKIHQAGKTDYLFFCNESAANGVEKWLVDLQHLTCTYYDLNGNEMLVDTIPS